MLMRQNPKGSRMITPATLAATLVGLKVYTDNAVRQAETLIPPIGQFVTVHGLRLHYVRKGTGQPVVFLHGNDGQLQDFTMSVLDRTAHAYQAIAFDRPGHGYSERPAKEAGLPRVQAQVLYGALQELEIERPILVGHSWGGALALTYALRYPNDIASLVVVSGYVYSQRGASLPGVLATLPLLSDLWRHTLGVLVMRRLVVKGLSTAFAPATPPPAYVAVVQALSPRPRQLKATAEDFAALNTALRALCPHYSAIRAPVVIVTGDADQVVPPQRHAFPLHQAIAHSRLVVLPNTGHMVQFSRPDAVLSALRLAQDSRPTPRLAVCR
jgi:pimeloyl-ACP methyl ester carboxylesterase